MNPSLAVLRTGTLEKHGLLSAAETPKDCAKNSVQLNSNSAVYSF
jgi:hypothetical protein